MSSYHEDCRPRNWQEIVGQDATVNRIKSLISRSWGGRAYWISGASGTGKTSIARLIAAENADVMYTEETIARDLSVSEYDRITRGHNFAPMIGMGHCVIVNEVHGMTKGIRERLLGELDPVRENVCWIFTTTNIAQASLFEDDTNGDNAALLSRCTAIKLVDNAASRLAMATRAKEMAMRDGLDGQPLEIYIAALSARNGSMRALLGDVECGRITELAQERDGIQRSLDMLKSTKGESAEEKRAELRRQLGR